MVSEKMNAKKQAESIFDAIREARVEGKSVKELRMQASTLWRLEPFLPNVLLFQIVEDETVTKGSVIIEWERA